MTAFLCIWHPIWIGGMSDDNCMEWLLLSFIRPEVVGYFGRIQWVYNLNYKLRQNKVQNEMML